MGKLGTRLIDKADTIVWLDLPLWILVQRRSPREVESWLAEQPEG
jgi:hypothetical protein